jgi:DNA-binding NarL/FixJ family response regulator
MRCSVPKIFLVDDHHQFRRQLRFLIETQDDWTVCSEAVDGHEAVEKHAEFEPHVTVMDFNMPRMDGLQASRKILSKAPEAAILMVTVFGSNQLRDEAKKAGLRGFCHKNESEHIIRGIQTLLNGGTYFPDQIH